MSNAREKCESANYSFLGPHKSLECILKEAEHDTQDTEKFGFFDLACVGIGGTVGAGVFVLSGQVIPIAGPSSTVSWIIAGVGCLISSISYVELAGRVPTKGSTYAFCQYALGEAAAIVGALCLTMEYALSSAGVAKGWSLKFTELSGVSPVPLFTTNYFEIKADWVAALLVICCASIMAKGINLSKLVVNCFAVAKVLLVLFLIIAGLSFWDQDIFSSTETFFPKGTVGTVRAASLVFMGYIGFDEVCCMASRAHTPRRTVPQALVFTIVGTMVLSVLAQLALVVMVPSTQPTSFEMAFEDHGFQRLQWVVATGEMAVIPLVVFVGLLPQPELLAAMAEDGVAPTLFTQKDSGGTYVTGAMVSGIIFALVALLVPFEKLWDLISVGILFSFNLTNSSLIMIRSGNGGQLRDKKALWLLLGLWISAALSGYGLYHVIFTRMNILVIIGLLNAAGALGFLWSLHGIIVENANVSDSDNPDVFHVPLVPWVPGLSMMLNFLLMATFPSAMLLVFICIAAVLLVLYYTCARKVQHTGANVNYGAI